MGNKTLVIRAHDMTLDQKVIALLMCIALEKKVEIERALEGTVQSFLQLKLLHSLAEAPGGRLTVGKLRSLMVEKSPNVSRTRVPSTIGARTLRARVSYPGARRTRILAGAGAEKNGPDPPFGSGPSPQRGEGDD